MNRLDEDLSWRWRLAINQFTKDQIGKSAFPLWMYETIAVADEVPRLALLFQMERENRLPDIHQQCSHSEAVPVEDNHLTCCLGTECRKCSFLLALDSDELRAEERDVVKAWTCVTHILAMNGIHQPFDTSEGFVLTTDDRMFWQNVYNSLADGDREDE